MPAVEAAGHAGDDGATAHERSAWRAAWRVATARVGADLERGARALEVVLDADGALLDRPDPEGGWSARQVLEHLALAEHFLLKLVDTCAAKAARRRAEGVAWPARAARLEHLAHLALRDPRWVHPPHMTPGTGTGVPPTADLRASLAQHTDRARRALQDHAEGQGTLHRIRMSVVDDPDDRLDLVQYVACVVLHRERHLGQLARLGLGIGEA